MRHLKNKGQDKMNITQKNVLFIVLGAVCLAFQSPKWLFPLASWLAPIFLILISRNNRWLKGSFFILLAYFVSGVLGGYGVIPFPLPILIFVVLVGSLINLIPYLADKFLVKERKRFLGTLIFPSAFLLIEYYNAKSPSGVWQSISGTQHSFLALIQIASVIGIWGIVFLIYWFASTVVFTLENRKGNTKNAITGGIIFLSVFIFTLIFGIVRLNQNNNDSKTVKVAAVTLDNACIFETIYKTVTGKDIKFSSDLSQTSPEVTEINKAFIEFLKDPDKDEYKTIKDALTEFNERAFEESKKAIQKGTKIIVWSEGLGLSMFDNKDNLIQRGKTFSQDNNVYLLLAYGAFYKGEPKRGQPILENKVLTINPSGEIVNEFQKNRPVPFVEQSAPGDGEIPVIKTEYANISPSICYDADFPDLISQTGKNETELLLIPTGDWKTISPYHSYITKFRAIENGISIVKSTSRGLSIAYDQYGRIIKERDFFDPHSEILISELPIKKVKTLYPYIGDRFSQVWILFLAAIFILHSKNWVKKKRIRKNTR
jgi:apolipoprotein N-acyltransferase